ncbi:MAG TPA: SprT family zinc-dependent metalloprotease [Candidatus Omnitrophota bacterium]|nr:SprT family zinc-dependent metalloprotease [Candidatus Omnitrophota bacterium]
MIDIPIHKLIRSRRKSIALMIAPDATLVVRAPLGISINAIQGLIEKKRKWIESKQSEVLKRGPVLRKTFTDGETFLFLGEEFSFKTMEGDEIQIAGYELLFPRRYLAKAEARLIYWYKEKAIEVIAESANHYSRVSGWKFKTINITGAERRWGSCSFSGAINFSWKLIMAPRVVVDYVVVHELAHITEKNHSSRFWKKVESVLPNYQVHEKWLKDHGKTLTF